MSLELPESRSFHMGFTTWSMDFTAWGGKSPEAIQRMYKTAAKHADIIVFHGETYDVPWREALAEKPYPKEVEEEIASRKSRVRKGQKVYLAVGVLNLGRDGLAGRPDDWKDKDFDDPEIIAAFTNHCRRMIREFKPDYMAYEAEANMLAMNNPAGFRKYLVLAKKVYEVLKKENPNLPIFLTFQIDHYYKDKEKQRAAVRRLLRYTDYIAVSCYPYMRGHTPDNLPEDWFSHVRELAPSKPFAIAETGYAAEDVVIGDWNVKVPGSEEWQAWYTRFILEESNRLNGKFVVWFFSHDYDSFLDQLKGEAARGAQLFRWWRDTGMLDGDGNPRESLRIWDEWLKLPLRARSQPPGPLPARIEVDCSQGVGTIRPMLGVNNGPRGTSGKDLTKAYREMGVDFIRTHDFYGPTDLHEIFPDWKADPTNPKTYSFESSDQKIKAIVDGGFKVLFRLGESWGGPRKPPPDFEKCAEVCRRIVMHYNEGWADGFRFGIRYWEIWNEPDIRMFWTGTPEQFYRLYELVAKKLKKHDATLKVGGPAASTIGRRYLEDFLKCLKEHNVPLDFYSWHFYGGFIFGGDARIPQRMDKRVRSALKQAGFEKAESICDEWNWTLFGPNRRGAGNAAFTAAALIAFQDMSVSIQTRYRGDDHFLGMFLREGKMDKPAYAYKAMRMMLDTPQRVGVTPSYGGSFAALAGLSEDGKKLSVLLADYSQRAGKLSIVIDNFGEENQKATMAIWVLDSKGDLVKIPCPTVSVRPSIKLEQEFQCPTVQLLQFELDVASK